MPSSRAAAPVLPRYNPRSYAFLLPLTTSSLHKYVFPNHASQEGSLLSILRMRPRCLFKDLLVQGEYQEPNNRPIFSLHHLVHYRTSSLLLTGTMNLLFLCPTPTEITIAFTRTIAVWAKSLLRVKLCILILNNGMLETYKMLRNFPVDEFL